jgi:hypothetical protein
MPDLDAVLGTVRERIEKWQGQGIGEQDTKATLIVLVRATVPVIFRSTPLKAT